MIFRKTFNTLLHIVLENYIIVYKPYQEFKLSFRYFLSEYIKQHKFKSQLTRDNSNLVAYSISADVPGTRLRNLPTISDHMHLIVYNGNELSMSLEQSGILKCHFIFGFF